MIVAALLLAEPMPVEGVWTNGEQVAFAEEAGERPPEWRGVRIITRPDGTQIGRRIDREGRENDVDARMMLGWQRNAYLEDGVLTMTPSAGFAKLRHADPFTCWVSVPRLGGEWLFRGDVKLFDGGARATVGGEDTGAEAVTIKLRNVIWPPPSTNRPSLVLYAYHADDTERAASYVWGEPNATRLGLNLRWMQASCTKDTP